MAPNTMETSIVCETSRLILRKFHESDVEPLLSFRGDPEVMRFSISGPQTRQDIQTRYLPGCLKRYSRDGLGQWAVVRKGDGICIGECGICVQEIADDREFEISYRGMTLEKRASFHDIPVLVYSMVNGMPGAGGYPP